ncbi:flagellin N-terminal helical domain-containing protein [Capillimicrobium parvum]|uniref:Flagellin n=1 Tax=Capillimicrobium parvum TaxID=2884022 RepID=A0A9E6XRT8_9ACTN|nr:Flagellin [Capillimicrobium parvum]
MSLRINHNVQALNAHRQLSGTSEGMSKAMERLSSGYRINRASDDAAGLGISEKMRGQIRGLAQANRNMQDGISLVQTAEANLDEVHSMLQRMRELAVQYQNGTMSSANQSAIQSEIYQLASEIDRIGQQAQFNGITFLATAGTVSFQVGANDGQVITVATISLGSTLPANYYDVSLGTSISNLDAAIESISATRSTFGAVQNRLEHSVNAASAYQENLVAAESRIRDVDMAEQMIEFTKLQVLQQAGTSMLSQANQSTQGVLSLLQG